MIATNEAKKCKCWKEMKQNVRDETVHICPDCNSCIFEDPERYEFIKKIDKNKRYMFIDNKEWNNDSYKTIEWNYKSYPTVGFVTWFFSNYPSISGKDISYRAITPFWTEDSWWRSYCEVELIEIEAFDIPDNYITEDI